jgi:hypothetical protein
MSEEQKTPEDRAKDFIKEYGELVQKHQIDFATYPQWVPDGQGGFKTIIQNQAMDVTPKEESIPTPFVEEEK